jgi:Flp pilus assembly protein TadB
VAPLWETETGHTMVMVSAVLIAIGYVICRKMASIEV